MRLLQLSFAPAICLLLAFGIVAFGAVQHWALLVMQVGAGLLLLLWTLFAIGHSGLEIHLSPLLLPTLLFAALIALQLVPGRSAYWFATWEKALLWAAYGMLLFLSVQFLRGRALQWFPLACTSFGFAMALIAIAQEFAGNGKLYWMVPNQGAEAFFGPYANHSHYAGMMEMLAPFALVLALRPSASRALRLIYACAAIVMGGSIFLSRSRGGIFAFMIEAACISIFWAAGHRKKALAGTALFLVLLCVSLALVRPHGLWGRFLQIGESTNKIYEPSRLTMLEDSFRMLRRRPILGWGFGTFPFTYPAFRSFYTDWTVNAAHNDFAELAVETGLVGLGLMLVFLYRLYRWAVPELKNWRNQAHASKFAALIGCTGLLVHSLSDFNLAVPANGALFFCLAAIAAGNGPDKSLAPTTLPALSRNGIEGGSMEVRSGL